MLLNNNKNQNSSPGVKFAEESKIGLGRFWQGIVDFTQPNFGNILSGLLPDTTPYSPENWPVHNKLAMLCYGPSETQCFVVFVSYFMAALIKQPYLLECFALLLQRPSELLFGDFKELIPRITFFMNKFHGWMISSTLNCILPPNPNNHGKVLKKWKPHLMQQTVFEILSGSVAENM